MEIVKCKCVKKGEIYYADLTPVKGSEQGGIRPVLVIQNDIGNKYSPTTIVCILTSKKNKSNMPTHVFLGQNYGLPKESFALLEQIRTIDKLRLKRKVGEIKDQEIMDQIDRAIHISFGLEAHGIDKVEVAG
ncbi:MAG: type II toxin-antitoxin system PemK/MazF family toxin [Thermoanaerobacteraceae bacterium]|nr:type II toxin-antitoxin system PemK/MazF family toxin [Thermoanaerobacteraceae bacterium]